MLSWCATAVLVALVGAAVGKRQILDACSSRTRTSPHESQCDAYYECFDNQPVLQHCPNGLAYHGKRHSGLLGVCDYDFNVDCTERPGRSLAQEHRRTEQPNPCSNKFKVAGDITHCDRYWECVNGEAQQFDCPNGLVFVGRFRGIAEGCDYPWRGGHCDGKQLANTPISTEHCDWLYGIFGHETSCTRYWTCWNGTSTEQFCIGGLLYNEETHACDWPQNVNGCQKHPLCKDDPNANVPLGKSCERYWSCQGGYPRLQRCPATLVFDKQSRRCVAPPTIDCEVPSTTPRTPSEEEEVGPPQRQQPAPKQQIVPLRRPSRPQEEPPVFNVGFQEPLDEGNHFVAIEDEAFPVEEEQQFVDDSSLFSQQHSQVSGAVPIGQNNRNFRPPPIPGAILLN